MHALALGMKAADNSQASGNACLFAIATCLANRTLTSLRQRAVSGLPASNEHWNALLG